MQKYIMSIFIGLVYYVTAEANAITLSVSPRSPVAGEQIQLIANINEQVKGSVSIAKRPSCPGLAINWQNPRTTQNIRVVNGRQTVLFSLIWSGRAIKAGDFSIPPLQLRVGSRMLESKPIPITVSSKQTGNFFLLKTSSPVKECYLGQVIPFHIDYLLSDQYIRQFEKISGDSYELGGNHYEPFSVPSSLEEDFYVTLKEYRSSKPQGNGAPYLGKPQNSATHSGFAYRHHRLTLLLEPKRVGRVTIPAIKTNFYKLEVKQERVTGFFGMSQMRRVLKKHPTPVVMSSSQKIIKVSAPPETNRPDTYSGMVCNNLSFSIEVPGFQKGQAVQRHSPIAVQFSMKSDLPPSSLRMPSWSSQPQLTEHFDVSSSSMVSEEASGGMLFKEIIFRAKDTKAKEVPSIAVSYFNPVKKQYVTVTTRPFPITVEAVDDEGDTFTQPLALASRAKKDIKESIGGVEGWEQNLTKLSQSKTTSFNLLFVTSIALTPWGVLLVLQTLLRLQAHHSNLRETKKFGLSASFRALDSATTPGAFLDILSRYITNRWNITDPHALSLPNAELQEEVRVTMQTIEASSYSSNGDTPAVSAANIKTLLKKLDKESN